MNNGSKTTAAMGDAASEITPENTPQLETSYRMPKTYLIVVICLSIFLGIVVIYKVYKHLRTKQLRIPCCVEGPQRNNLQRRDTFKPLIRTGSNASNGSVQYEQRSRGGPDSV